MPKSPFFAFAVVCMLSTTPSGAEVPTRTLNDGNLVLSGIPEIPTDLADQLVPYQNVRSAAFLNWSGDGKSIYVATRFGEVSQIHRVDQAGGARHQITFYQEPMGGVARRPDSDEMIFSMDEGGDEFHQLYLFDPKTGQRNLLTDGDSKNRRGAWSHDGSLLAFGSTRRNGSSNDVWIMAPEAPEKATLALESPDGTAWYGAGFSLDKKRLIIGQFVSAEDSRIHLLDLESKELSPFAGSSEAPSRNSSPAFDRDESGLFYLTDEGGEFRQLAYRSLEKSADTTLITENIPWNVRSYNMNKERTRGAFVTNEDGLSRLYLFDPSTFKYRAVEGLPIGLLGGVKFSPDSSRLAFTMNTARTPSDAFVLDLGKGALESGAMTRWTYSEVGGLDTDRFSEPELIRYPTFDQVDGRTRTVPAFLYKPDDKGPHPVVISIHGGPEGQARPGFSSQTQRWISELGVAVLVPNVRGSAGYGKTYLGLDNGFKREDSVKDIGALLDWISTQPDLDDERVVVYGGSYGGYMVLASAVHYSDRLRGAIDVVGISNFVTFLENTQAYRRDLRRVEYGDERDPEMRAHLKKISPLNNAEKIKVPLFVIQGQNDPRVPVTEAEQIVDAVRKQDQPVWYLNALNEGHGYRKKENRDVFSQTVLMFLKKCLK
ncbi:MAG: alpha/beta fold hydrolase [Akkermansiaceae bacterium]